MNALRRIVPALARGLRRAGYLVWATVQAVILGIIETVTSERGRRLLALVAFAGIVGGLIWSAPIRSVDPGVVAVRLNRVTGAATSVPAGWVIVAPWLHELRAYPAGDRVYRPEKGESAGGSSPYQTAEGLSIGVDVTVRYRLDPANGRLVAQGLPDDLGARIIEPVTDAILHRVLARHSIREIFATDRTKIEEEIALDLRPLLAEDGVVVRAIFLGKVDLPADYRAGLEGLLAEELATEKMKYTLALKEKQVKETELVAIGEKTRREKAAEAAAQEEIIAARAREEAMKHILPLKEKEIEQRRLEAEGSRVTRLRMAETEAEARRIEAAGEADYRKKLAESEAYRIEITGKATSEQLARDASLISKNPLLIQKSLADKLSDKIQVIIAPPEAGGFFASGLLGRSQPAAPAPATAPAAETAEEIGD